MFRRISALTLEVLILLLTVGSLSLICSVARAQAPSDAAAAEKPAKSVESAPSTVRPQGAPKVKAPPLPKPREDATKTAPNTGVAAEKSASDQGEGIESEKAGEESQGELAGIIAELAAKAEELSKLRARILSGGEVQRELLEAQLVDERNEYRRSLREVTATYIQSKDGSTDEERKVAERTLQRLLTTEAVEVRKEYAGLKPEFLSRVALAEKATPDEAAAASRERNQLITDAQLLLEQLNDSVASRESLGMNVGSDLDYLKTRLLGATKLGAGILSKIKKDLGDLSETTVEASEEQVLETQRLKDYQEVVAKFQRSAVKLMDARKMDTAKLRQALITETGAISKDILDAEVASGLFEKWQLDAKDWLLEHGPVMLFRGITFLLIVGLFWGVGIVARGAVRRALSRSRAGASTLASEFFVKMTGRAFLLLGVSLGLAQIGFDIGTLLAGLGVAGFVIGFALQNTLSNFASGMMILVYRPYDVGDIVEAGGVKGQVVEMSLVATSVLTFDNQMLIVPNSKIWGDVICNVTHQKTRRVDLVFGIGYGDDIARAEEVLMEILVANELVLKDPEPVVRLHELGDSSVNFVVRPWVNTEDYWVAYWEVTREVKRRFDAEGISIPFPQRDVHIHHEQVQSSQREPREAAESFRGD